MRQTLSPKHVASALGVSEASVKRWCDKGFLDSERTAGGHRRLTPAAVVRFIRASGSVVADPGILGLTADVVDAGADIDNAAPAAALALEAGDRRGFERLILGLFLRGSSVAEIGDRVIGEAMQNLGKRWEENAIEVYVEHRAVEICMGTLHELERLIGPPPDGAPLAIGLTLEGDPYTVAPVLGGLTLRELGWRAEWYGPSHPPATAAAAVAAERPRLLWLSVSSVADPSRFAAGFALFRKAAEDAGTAMVVGGRGLSESLRRELSYSAYGDSLQHLAAFARTIHAPRARPKGRGGK